MSKKFLFSSLFCLLLALPAHTTAAPAPDPVPGIGKTSSSTGPQGQVLVIRTAKDPKVDQIKVGEKGEILIPQSTAIAGAAIAGAAAGGAASPGAGALKETEAGDDAKSGGDSNKAEGAGGFSGASGSSGSGDSKTSNLSSGGLYSGSTGIDNGLLAGGAASGFSSNPALSGTGGGGAPIIFTITASAGAHGAISPAGVVSVNSGASLTFTITPDSGYHVAGVLVDGVWAGQVTSFTFSNVTANHTIAATFAVLPTAQLQALLDQAVSDAGIPGAVMAVQTPTDAWIGASGKADLGTNQVMTTDMQVSLAAGGTKLFTAALIMKLVEEGKLALTDTVAKWLPGQVVPGGDKTAAAKITVGMLLNHTSGLHDHDTTQKFVDRLYLAPALPWSNADVLALTNSYPLDFPPGTAYSYCNTNYFLLGMIAEAATGDLVDKLIQTRFFAPLGLSRTALTRGGQKTIPNPQSYWFGVPPFAILTDTTNWDLSWDWTSGSGVSTASDMLTWLRALFGSKLVNAQSLQQMTSPQAPATTYGFGLEVVASDPWFGEKAYKSDGETVGAYARWLYYPASGRTIFIAFNRDDKRFLSTDPPPLVKAPQIADNILNAASALIKAAQ